jgi:carbon dioxide concentrating mechanism protein CcmN
MNLPPLQPISNSHFYVSGNVTIDPNAAIAPGVILQADPNSQITIAAGACIGMGVVLHAYEGSLEVETGANLGAGVLVIGKVKIGANACIGSATTIFNCSIESNQVIPPGSLFGDSGHQVIQAPEVPGVTPLRASFHLMSGQISTTDPAASEASPSHYAPEPSENHSPKVYGQEYLNQFIGKLLPYKQSLS